jgi:streptogramin lyase
MRRALVALVAAGVLVGGSADAAKPRRSAIPVGNRPFSVALAAGAIWATNYGDGTVAKVSPRRGRVVGRVQVGGQPWGIVYGAGSIWVGNFAGASVARIDPVRRRVVARIRVGRQPVALSFDSRARLRPSPSRCSSGSIPRRTPSQLVTS